MADAGFRELRHIERNRDLRKDPDRGNAVFRVPGGAERLKHTIECLYTGLQSTGGIWSRKVNGLVASHEGGYVAMLFKKLFGHDDET